MSIFIFYKISTSIFTRFWRHFLQFFSRLTSDSTTFKVAVSHFVFYPCGALVMACVLKTLNECVMIRHAPFSSWPGITGTLKLHNHKLHSLPLRQREITYVWDNVTFSGNVRDNYPAAWGDRAYFKANVHYLTHVPALQPNSLAMSHPGCHICWLRGWNIYLCTQIAPLTHNSMLSTLFFFIPHKKVYQGILIILEQQLEYLCLK